MKPLSWWEKQVSECDFSFSETGSDMFREKKIIRLGFQPERVYNSNFKDLLHDLEAAEKRVKLTFS